MSKFKVTIKMGRYKKTFCTKLVKINDFFDNVFCICENFNVKTVKFDFRKAIPIVFIELQ